MSLGEWEFILDPKMKTMCINRPDDSFKWSGIPWDIFQYLTEFRHSLNFQYIFLKCNHSCLQDFCEFVFLSDSESSSKYLAAVSKNSLI